VGQFTMQLEIVGACASRESSRCSVHLPLPRHHCRQQLVKHLIDLLRHEPLHRSGPAQFVMDLVEDCAELSRECDDPLAVDAVDQCKPFYRSATGLGLDGEVDGLDGLQTGVSGGGHRADPLPPRPETKLSQIKEAQFLNSPGEVVGVLEASGMKAPRPPYQASRSKNWIKVKNSSHPAMSRL
jgi:hypothetical protein